MPQPVTKCLHRRLPTVNATTARQGCRGLDSLDDDLPLLDRPRLGPAATRNHHSFFLGHGTSSQRSSIVLRRSWFTHSQVSASPLSPCVQQRCLQTDDGTYGSSLRTSLTSSGSQSRDLSRSAPTMPMALSRSIFPSTARLCVWKLQKFPLQGRARVHLSVKEPSKGLPGYQRSSCLITAGLIQRNGRESLVRTLSDRVLRTKSVYRWRRTVGTMRPFTYGLITVRLNKGMTRR
jgi:hypothetical protein